LLNHPSGVLKHLSITRLASVSHLSITHQSRINHPSITHQSPINHPSITHQSPQGTISENLRMFLVYRLQSLVNNIAAAGLSCTIARYVSASFSLLLAPMDTIPSGRLNTRTRYSTRAAQHQFPTQDLIRLIRKRPICRSRLMSMIQVNVDRSKPCRKVREYASTCAQTENTI
jgi:hypothetical protein